MKKWRLHVRDLKPGHCVYFVYETQNGSDALHAGFKNISKDSISKTLTLDVPPTDDVMAIVVDLNGWPKGKTFLADCDHKENFSRVKIHTIDIPTPTRSLQL